MTLTYRVEYYDSPASLDPTGPDTGSNAPDGGGRWWPDADELSLAMAEERFHKWTTMEGRTYKRCRIIEVATRRVMRDSRVILVVVV